MSFWSGERLAVELPRLIDPFDAAKIDCAAYTLRIGSEVYISPSSTAEASTRTKVTLGPKQGFVIPPGQFAFLLTEERVEVPSSAIAFISMKARIKFKGLVNVSGFHVDPGYSGFLVFAVFNAGPAAVHLARGDDCFLIWYASLDAASTTVRRSPPFEGITSDLIGPISGEVQSLKGLSDRIDKVEREQRVTSVVAGILVTLAITSMVIGITLISKSWQPPASGSSVSAPPGSRQLAPSGSAGAAPTASPSGSQVPSGSPAPANGGAPSSGASD